MGKLDSITVALWIEFLKSKGCSYKSFEDSHEKWRCPGCNRSIIFRPKDKVIPILHISTTLKTMGLTKTQLREWLDERDRK